MHPLEPEARIPYVLDALEDLVFFHDEEGRYVDYHRGASGPALFREPSEFLGKRFDEIGFPEDLVRKMHAAFRALREGETPARFTYSIDLPSGPRIFQARAVRRTSSAGAYAGAAIVVRDITERVRAEAVAQARTAQQEAMAVLGAHALAGAPLAALMEEAVRLVARALDVEFAKVLELVDGGESLLLRAGVGWRDGCVGTTRIGTERTSQAGYTLLTREPVIVSDLASETRFHGPDLLLEHGIVSGVSVAIGVDEALFGVIGAHSAAPREFTEQDAVFLRSMANLLAVAIQRHRAGAALRESEERFRHLLSSIQDMVWSSTLDGSQVLFVNEAVERIYGITQAEFRRRPHFWYDIVHPDDLPQVRGAVERLRETGTAEFEYRIVDPDGRVRWLFERTVAIRDDAGDPVRYGGVVSDITEQKRLEEELRQANKMEAIGRLAGGVAHDFNNLLTVILGRSQVVLERPALESRVRHDLVEIQKAAERGANLTRQLLAFGRQQVLRPRVLDLNQVVQDMSRMLQRLMGEGIELITRFETDAAPIRADLGQIEQILLNLAVNARDAMPEGGRHTITTATVTEGELAGAGRAPMRGPLVRLTVGDTGHGMEPEVLSRIFEPFFTTKGMGKGTGLGLSTVFGIVRQSGGDIVAESAIGAGTLFRIYLPRVDEPVEPAAPDQRHDVRFAGSGSVLLVEDEASVRDLVRTMLAMIGFEVLVARDGMDALALSEHHEGTIDLLVTDVIMPGVTGPELAGRMQELRPGLRVLYMSGYTDERLADVGFSTGRAGFLQKPFTLEALTEALRDVMR
jgi:PAS domain S-box-containing protein